MIGTELTFEPTELTFEPPQLGGKTQSPSALPNHRASEGWLNHTREDTDRLGEHVCVPVREHSGPGRNYKFQGAQRRAARGL